MVSQVVSSMALRKFAMRVSDKQGGTVAVRIMLPLMALLALSGCPALERSYPLLKGDAVALSELRGKWVFINYWAEWCAPCRAEIPELNAFAVAHPADVRVLSVNFDGASGASLEAQVATLGIAFPTLLVDPRADLSLPAPLALPETVVIDREGKVHQVLSGPQTLATLEQVLAQPARPGRP